MNRFPRVRRPSAPLLPEREMALRLNAWRPTLRQGIGMDRITYTPRVLNEIASAEARLQISLWRIDGGSLRARARSRPAREAGRAGRGAVSDAARRAARRRARAAW